MAGRYEVREFEAFPVYHVAPLEPGATCYDREVTLTEDEFADYTRVCEQYQAWQDRLETLYQGRPRPGIV